MKDMRKKGGLTRSEGKHREEGKTQEGKREGGRRTEHRVAGSEDETGGEEREFGEPSSERERARLLKHSRAFIRHYVIGKGTYGQ